MHEENWEEIITDAEQYKLPKKGLWPKRYLEPKKRKRFGAAAKETLKASLEELDQWHWMEELG